MESQIISTLAARKKTMLALFFIINCIITTNPHAQTWQVYTTFNSGLPSNVVYDVAFDTNNIKWIGTEKGLAKFDGTNWTVYDTANSPLPVPSIGDIAIDRSNVIWLCTGGGGVVKFDGINWTIYDTNNSPIRSNIVSDITIDNADNKWFCTTRGLAKFDGVSWTIYNTTNSGLPANQTWCIALEGNTKWIGIFAFSGGLVKYNDTNWVVYNTGNSGLPSNVIRGVAVDYLGNKWMATQFGGVAKFNSTANQWTVYNTTNSGLPSNNNTTIITQNHIKWIGSGWLAKYNDTNWAIFTPSNSPLPGEVITLSIDRTGRLWIGTDLGLAVYDTGIIGINNQNSNTPKSFELKQNYPNPFNPLTNIKYQLLKSSFVSIKIFDVSGQEITSLINNRKNTGTYEINFNGSDLPSGIYFYSLYINGGITETKKMVLIK